MGVSGERHQPRAERTEEALLLHSLGNAVAMLFFDLDALQQARGNPEAFKEAHASMYKELVALKGIVRRAAEVLAPRCEPRSEGDATRRDGVSREAARSEGKKDSVMLEGKSPIRVLCVDDSTDITDGLRLIIESEPDMQFVGALASADSLVREIAHLCKSEASEDGTLVVLLDAVMPGKDSFSAIGEVAAACPQARTVVYSGYDGPEFAERALRAGAWRCISKNDDPVTLLRLLREVARASGPWKA